MSAAEVLELKPRGRRRPKRAAAITLEPHDRVAVIGMSGTGKSNWLKDQLEHLLEDGAAIVAFDPMDELSVDGELSDQRRLGPLTTRITFPEFIALGSEAVDFLEEHEAVAIVPAGKTGRELTEELAAVTEIVEQVGDLVLVLEEVGLYQRHAVELLEHVYCRFRHAGVPVIGVAQRAVMIPASCRAQLTQVISFRQKRAADLAALEQDFDSKIAEAVPRLRRGEFHLWREDN